MKNCTEKDKQKKSLFSLSLNRLIFFNWDSLDTRLNSHYEA